MAGGAGSLAIFDVAEKDFLEQRVWASGVEGPLLLEEAAVDPPLGLKN